jgi:topoisomerase IV subunit A
MKGHVEDTAEIKFKEGDRAKFELKCETTDKLLVFGTNGKIYTLGVDKLPGGRGHGEPIRLFIELEQEADVVAVFPFRGGRKFLLASRGGYGFVVPEDETLATTRKGKQALNVEPPDEARAIAAVEGELVASIGENRKMVIFPLEQLPEMTRGRGVRIQRYKDGGLSDVKTFRAADGLVWLDAADRTFTLTLKELADWRGNRADAGRLAPKGFPRSNKFGRAPEVAGEGAEN